MRSATPAPAGNQPPGRAVAGTRGRTITVAGVTLVADPAGALYWPDEQAARRRRPASGEGLGLCRPRRAAAALRHGGDAWRGSPACIARYAPRLVIALGDSFHDGGGPARIAAADRAALRGTAARARLDLDRRQSRSRSGRRHRRHALPRRSAFGPLTFRHEPCGGRVRRRDRRPSASGRAGRPARPRRQPALLRRRRHGAW